jgi:hypothetical protein
MLEGLQAVVPDVIWVAERPVWFSGVRLRARSAVVRLTDGGLWLHSPPPPTDAICAALDALGPVRWLVVPNCFHHLATPAFAARYPEARVVGPRSALARNPDLRLHQHFEDGGAQAVPELEALPLAGVPFLDETVFFHRPTGSLIAADLVLSAGPGDHWTWRAAARLTGCYGRIRVPPDVRAKTKASALAAGSLDALLALPLQRLLVAHTEPIEDDPKARLEEAWGFVRPG